MDGVNVGTHELFTPSELVGGLRCPARADGLKSGWVDS